MAPPGTPEISLVRVSRSGSISCEEYTNNQSVALSLTSIVATGEYTAAPGGATPCGASVAAKGKCSFSVTFSPTSTGTIKGAVTVTHNANGSPQVIALTGTGQ